MKEKDVAQKIIKKLREIPNSWFRRVENICTKGDPDIIGCINGRFIAVEVKHKSKLTELQKHTLEQIKLSGGYADKWDNDNWKDKYRELIDGLKQD